MSATELDQRPSELCQPRAKRTAQGTALAQPPRFRDREPSSAGSAEPIVSTWMRRAGSAEKLNAFFADKARAAADQASRATDNVVRTVDEALLSAEDEPPLSTQASWRPFELREGVTTFGHRDRP